MWSEDFQIKFGHRGANQPVQHLETGKVEVTSQNHGFAVDEQSLPDCLEITHRNLNDNTIAGVRHKSAQAFSVQYHPEASPAPTIALTSSIASKQRFKPTNVAQASCL